MVQREVIIDLLPVYVSGEASAATRALVEESVKSDPELATLLERERALLGSLPSLSLSPDHEKRALDKTKAHVRWRSLTLAAALFFTVLPLTFTWESGRGVTWVMWQALPRGCVGFLTVAAILWAVQFSMRLRLRRIGI
jgi:anti-sigma factor RsiW